MKYIVALDVFGCFRDSVNEIREAIDFAYPENNMSSQNARQALSQIRGVHKTLKNLLGNKISAETALEHTAGEEVRDLYSEWKPSQDVGVEAELREKKAADLEVDPVLFLSEAVKDIGNTLGYAFPKGEYDPNRAHAALQRLGSSIQLISAFLNCIKTAVTTD